MLKDSKRRSCALRTQVAAAYPTAVEWATNVLYSPGRVTLAQLLGPAPETAAVDAAVLLLGKAFPAVPAVAQETAVELLLKAVKATKFGSPKRHATQANIVTALLAALRTVTGPGRKGTIAKGKVLTGIQELLQVRLRSVHGLSGALHHAFMPICAGGLSSELACHRCR